MTIQIKYRFGREKGRNEKEKDGVALERGRIGEERPEAE